MPAQGGKSLFTRAISIERHVMSVFSGINFRWRVVDIVIAAVLAVACGVAFWGWDTGYVLPNAALHAFLPGFEGLLNGVWILAAVLVPLVVRKPGAAVFAEIVAAAVEALLGSQWGGGVALLYGLIQGLGAELVFAIFLYRKWNLTTALIAGAASAIGESLLDIALYNAGQGIAFKVIYIASSMVSGAVIAGLLSWLLVRSLARTGALSRFAAGRTSRALV
jgi:energy-coupling factor transport system substrate-specific component